MNGQDGLAVCQRVKPSIVVASGVVELDNNNSNNNNGNNSRQDNERTRRQRSKPGAQLFFEWPSAYANSPFKMALRKWVNRWIVAERSTEWRYVFANKYGFSETWGTKWEEMEILGGVVVVVVAAVIRNYRLEQKWGTNTFVIHHGLLLICEWVCVCVVGVPSPYITIYHRTSPYITTDSLHTQTHTHLRLSCCPAGRFSSGFPLSLATRNLYTLMVAILWRILRQNLFTLTLNIQPASQPKLD